jgi:hypothetical protein
MWIAIAALSWLYARAADHGHVSMQFFSLGATAAILAGYTGAVIDVEHRYRQRQLKSDRQAEVGEKMAQFPGSPITEYLSEE